MAVEIFLKLDGIDGESKSTGHENEIEVFSFSFGASNPSSVAMGTGSGAGKVDLSSISLQKQVDKASPILFLNCCKGTHVPTGTLVVREAGGDAPVEYLKLDLTQVFVDSVSWGGASGGGKPSESVSLSFAQVKYSYAPQKDDGTPDTAIEHGWNIKTNAAAA